MKEQPQLNRVETWIAERSTRIFLVIACLMVLAAGFAIWQIARQNHFQEQVDVLRPQVTRIVRRVNACTKTALTQPARSRECARQLKIAFKSCSMYPACRAAVLSAVLSPASPPKGVVHQNPSHAGQQPKPGSHPGSRHSSSQPPPSATEPAPASVPSTPAPVPSPLPGNSGSAPAPDMGVKACVELAVSACVKAAPDLPTH